MGINPRTELKRVAAELPKIKLKPRIIVARGTRDVSVSDLLKMSRQRKIMRMSATATSTASSLATAEPTSWGKKRN